MTTKENTFAGPTVMYGPDGKFDTFLDSNDVPDGWRDSPTPADPVPEKPAGAALPMTRAEITAALKDGKVSFKGNANTGELYATLLAALTAHCASQEIAVPEGASAPDLLALLAAG